MTVAEQQEKIDELKKQFAKVVTDSISKIRKEDKPKTARKAPTKR